MIKNFYHSRRILFSRSHCAWIPPTDVVQADRKTFIKMDAAGLDEQSLQITAAGRQLVVRGRRAQDRSAPGAQYQLMEIPYGGFERIFEFSHTLEQATISARYDLGFLLIEISHPDRTAAQAITIKVLEDIAE